MTQQPHKPKSLDSSNHQAQLLQQQLYDQRQHNIFNSNSQTFYHTTAKPQPTSTTTTTTTTTPKPEEKKTKPLDIELPDEVPDDLREQLLSSGILANAQISVLDYDKVGDIPLSALPPDQLANFYGAGGAQQIAAAGSEPKPVFVRPESAPQAQALTQASNQQSGDLDAEGSEESTVEVPKSVEMKVVHYDPQTQKGQDIQQSYVQEGATQVDPVVLNDQQYTRYLPLKVSGAQFPIPDVPELRGKNIDSVVVLAPVDLSKENLRITRDTKEDEEDAGKALKVVLENPTLDNYRRWLDRENKTSSEKQSVILLVTG